MRVTKPSPPATKRSMPRPTNPRSTSLPIVLPSAPPPLPLKRPPRRLPVCAPFACPRPRSWPKWASKRSVSTPPAPAIPVRWNTAASFSPRGARFFISAPSTARTTSANFSPSSMPSPSSTSRARKCPFIPILPPPFRGCAANSVARSWCAPRAPKSSTK